MNNIVKTKTIIKDLKSAFNIIIAGMMPFIQNTINPFLTTRPYWDFTIYAVIGLYGVYLALKQDELNELLVFVKDHPHEFRKEIVSSIEFKKGFIKFFDSYVKERLDKKRIIMRQILLGFTLSKEKNLFELERLQDALLRISPEALKVLIFIKQEILPIIKENVNKEMANHRNIILGDSKRLLDIAWKRQSVSEIIMKWIYDQYDSNSPLVKKQYKIGTECNPELSVKIASIKHKKTNEKTECWPELLGLGIFRIAISEGGMGGGAGTDYYLTKFGLNFIKYLTKLS